MFVANRVATIHDGSRPNQWRYVELSLNPADDASRGLDADAMLHSKRWIEGPSFLSKDESAWPVLPNLKPVVFEGDSEVRQNAKVHCATSSADMLDGLFTRDFSWYKLKKCSAWLLRFKTLLFDRTKSPSTETFQWNRGNLTVSEIDCAENEIVRLVQNQCFGDELEQLHSRGSVKRSSSLYKLELTLNTEGILCVRGRLGRAPIAIKTRHPMILPKNHPIVSLIVRHYHQRLGHSGRENVLSEVRERYWLIRAHTAVCRELRNYVKCQRLHGRLGTERMADLGKLPYNYVGVDWFGPFQVKRGRSLVKRYGCLFTCLTIRAIHIEKLDSMDADSFLMPTKKSLRTTVRISPQRNGKFEKPSRTGTTRRSKDIYDSKMYSGNSIVPQHPTWAVCGRGKLDPSDEC